MDRPKLISGALFAGGGGLEKGLPHRVERIRLLGNAVMPMQAREAFRRLMFGG